MNSKFLNRQTIAELIGTFWLVFGGCGSAIFAGQHIGFAGISLAFGLTVLTMAYAIGHVSGCHLNPAVSVGLWVAKRFETEKLLPYIIAQCVGAILAITIIWAILSGENTVFTTAQTYAANGFGDLSPGKFNFLSAALGEIVLTFIFLFVILSATDERAPQGFAPIAIGLCLTLIHLVGIPLTNLSVNPARSLAPALFAGEEYLLQVWFFWVMPLIGAALAGITYKVIFAKKD